MTQNRQGMRHTPCLRFPEFQNAPAWEEKRLGELGSIVSGGTPLTTKKNYWDGDILWVTPTEIAALKTKYIADTARKITKNGLAASSATLIPEKSLIVCTRATVGEMALNIKPLTTNQGFKSIIFSRNFYSEFIYYDLECFVPRLKNMASGSTFLEVSKATFEEFSIFVPALPEQKKIAGCLSSLDALIEATSQKAEKLKEYKKGLMQKLFPA